MNKLLFRLYKYYLTYCGSLVNRIGRCTSIHKSVFITKFDGLGDFFLLLPILHHLIKKGVQITIAGPSFQSEILTHCGLPVSSLSFDTHSGRALSASLLAARNIHPEYAINLSMNIWGGMLVNHTRAPHMIGLIQEPEWYVYKGTSFFYDRTVTYDPSLHGFNVAVRLFEDLLKTGDIEPFLARPVSDNGIIVIHPYGRWAPRRWPHYEALISRLVDLGYRIDLIGTAEEHKNSTMFNFPLLTDRCSIVSLASITDLLTRLEQCHAFIGNDSGPAHYAGLIGKPTFVLWGPGNYDRVRPLGKSVHVLKKDVPCRPCRQKGPHCPKKTMECLTSITAQEVVDMFSTKVPIHG